MGTSFKSLLILFVAIFACTDSALLRRRICARRVQTCSRQFRSAVQGIQSQEPDIDVACEMASNARTCMGRCLSVITASGPLERAIVRVLEYVCDEDIRDEIKQVSQASCFRDGTLKQQFEDQAQQCAQNMTVAVERVMGRGLRRGNPDVQELLCPLVHDVIGCIDEKVEELCGEEVVPVINNIFVIVLREMLVGQLPNCFDQVTATHSVVKRAVEYIAMLQE